MTSGLSQWIFKLVVGGAGGVGKSALIERYTTGNFRENHKMTIGAQFLIKQMTIDDHTVKLQIWDFAGEERFRFLLGDYCRGANGAFVCYDVTDYSTFAQIPEWLGIIRKNAGMIPVVLIGNKYDLPIEKHEIDVDVAEKYAIDAKCLMNVMCSAKLNLNVEQTFQAVAKWLIYFASEEAEK